MFEISKKFISFIPIKMLLLDEGMERYIKNLMYKNNLSWFILYLLNYYQRKKINS